MSMYYQAGPVLLPESCQGLRASDPIDSAIPIRDFQWRLGLRVYDPEAQEARLEVVHIFPESTRSVSRTWIFPCIDVWDISDCYAAILSLPAYHGSVIIDQ